MSQEYRRYEFFEHTADTGLKVYGRTLEELFTNAAQGLIELLVEKSSIASTDTRLMALSAPSLEALLQCWLKELLFWFSAERFLPGDYHFDTLTETELRGRMLGERFDPARHAQGLEVKGVTSHAYRVQRIRDRWEASVIFDV